MRRKPMKKSESRRDFRRKSGSHPKNTLTGPSVSRGGYRL
nr:MAG: hypothetical protein [Microvirus sp.]